MLSQMQAQLTQLREMQILYNFNNFEKCDVVGLILLSGSSGVYS